MAFSPCPKPSIPLVLERHARKRAKASKLEDAYAAVDRRDQGLCRATGTFTIPGATSPAKRREHHHLIPRSLRPDLIAEPNNIITVSGLVHQLITTHALNVEGTRADQRIVFHWNCLLVAKGAEPCRLLSKRRSERERIA